MNDVVYRKSMENVRKHRDFVKIEKETIWKLSETKETIRIKLSYYKVFHRKSIKNRNEKNAYTSITNEPVH